jgi:hypothetical protein
MGDFPTLSSIHGDETLPAFELCLPWRIDASFIGTAPLLLVSCSSDRGIVRYLLYLIEQCIKPCILILPTSLVSVAPTSRD